MKKFILGIWYTLLFQFEQHRNEIPDWWYEKNPQSFDSLPDWRKRVTIAKDVILQINVKRYVPKQGKYVNVDSLNKYQELQGSVQENFNNIHECCVCGIGACFMSIVKFKNNVNFEEIPPEVDYFKENEKFRTLLKSIFPIKQLLLIEHAFEKGTGAMFRSSGDPYLSSTEEYEAESFGNRFYSDLDRLKAIMQNIIYNKGEFKP